MAAPKGNKYASFNNAEMLGKRKRDWVQQELNSFRGKKTIALYNQIRQENESDNLTPEQWLQLGETYRPDSKIPEATVKRFLNNEIVKSYSDFALMQKI